MTKYSVLISYASIDLPLAKKVLEVMKSKSIDCWSAFANIKASESWPAAISNAISECEIFLLILTANSNNSRQVIRELTQADNLNKKLYCFQTENIAISKDLEYFFSSIQRHQAFDSDLEKELKEMADDIYTLLSQPSKNTVLQSNPTTHQNFQEEISPTGRATIDEDKIDDWKPATSIEITRQNQQEVTGVSKTIEDILNDLDKDARLARNGTNNWVVKEGSAIIKIRYNIENFFIAGHAYLCQMPTDAKKIKSLYQFLLQENYKTGSLVLSCTKKNIVLGCVIYDSDMNKETGTETFRNLFEKAADYDDLLKKGYGCLNTLEE